MGIDQDPLTPKEELEQLLDNLSAHDQPFTFDVVYQMAPGSSREDIQRALDARVQGGQLRDLGGGQYE